MKNIFLLCLSFVSIPAFACDTYNLRQILQNGGMVEIDSSCSAYDARSLAQIGKSRLTVRLAGFSAYDARNIAQEGASLQANAEDFSAYDMRNIASVAKELLTVNLAGYSGYDARNIVNEGVSFTVDNSFSAYDTRNICEQKKSPAIGSVYSKGFSEYDLDRFKDAGCKIILNGPDSDLTVYKARQILASGGSLEIGSQFSAYDTRGLAQIGKERLTVRLYGFSGYDARNIVQEGASFYVDQSFSAYDARRICAAKSATAKGWVLSEGFSDYDLRQIAEAGCTVVMN